MEPGDFYLVHAATASGGPGGVWQDLAVPSATADPDAPAPRTSVVIPVRARLPLTRACLHGLRRQALADTEVIVVDDGSPPAERAALDAFVETVTVLDLADGSGFAAACNTGVAAATGRQVVLLNNDVLPLPGWLAALESYAAAHPAAGIIGARLIWPDRTIQHAGIVVDANGWPHHLYGGLPADHPAPCRSRRLQAVTGAAMFVRRAVWEELHGLDSDFRNGYEDIDLCLRAARAGHEVHLCGDAVLLHLGSATRGATPLRDRENFARLTARWGRLPSDELATYADDGLLITRHDPDGLSMEIAPELARVTGTGPEHLQALLAERTREVHELRREMLRLRAAASDPWLDVDVS